MLWQVLQAEPNNEVAWLWLASVAADQPEYQHALNQVLRINPNNQRAQQLLAEFQQQQTPPPTPPPAQQYAQPVSPQPAPPSYDYSPRPPEPVQGVPAPQQQAAYSPVYAQPQQRPVEVQVREKRGCLGCLPGVAGCTGCLGCGGCGQGCIIALVLLVVLPVLACGALTFANVSLGPLDIPARYLPGEFGRKSITVETRAFDVTLDVPRSWYYASADDDLWSMWVDMLDSAMPFESDTQTWVDFESIPGDIYNFVDIDPAMLTNGGDVIGMMLYANPVTGTFSCDAVRNQAEADAVISYGDDLCGYRTDEVSAASAGEVFKGIDPPDQTRRITFFVPLSISTATRWQITLPDDVFDQIDSQIEHMIESVEVKQN